MQLASSGMNFSAAPAAAMWWDTCPIGAQQFWGSSNETLPTQTHEPLADVLEEIGLGSTNDSHFVVDLKAFLDSIGDRPIFSHHMLFNAAIHQYRAHHNQTIVLTNCYGKSVSIDFGGAVKPGYVQLMFER